MDLTRLAVDAGQFINRAVQYTEESLGQADKTELDPGLEELLTRADATKTWTDQIISQTEVLLQPNPGARLEDRLYEHLDWSVPPRPRAHEVLGDQMSQAGLEIGPNTPYGMALLRCGEVQKQLGEAEKKFVQSTNIHFLNPLRGFTEGEYRAIQDERKTLVNKRLDLDIAITRVRKAHEADREARNLNANPIEEDYLSHVSYMFSFLRVKWMKMWAQEISQTNHMRCLTDFVEAQACYFDQCNQHAQELQKHLASIPAFLCSNNWQSSVSNAVNQPSTSNHVANESVGLNQGTPLPILVHQLPEFDQDSWTLNPPPATDTSLTTQPPNQTNNNNNNNTFFTNSQVTSHRSAANQAFNHARISNSEPTDTAAISNGTGTTTTTTAASPPSELSGSECQTAGAVGRGAITTDNMDIEASATNGAVAEPQTANDAASELPAINEQDVQESSTDSQAVLQ
ncbi:Endophilin-B1 SH3 domain-containing GRB2-like protein B1 [Collichthys lucidus]|uniref:Endophilin-B1 SH3 domain-containing GRB2-like protein B1 n=1 Tax=Collichthys lucidus TaxID=240159 RepID=A0A4U5VGN4_COLLU|nr:Endophilin-B1 SH3 domain-containing GRB2-like protein B1 [Collichthys lucidus]